MISISGALAGVLWRAAGVVVAARGAARSLRSRRVCGPAMRSARGRAGVGPRLAGWAVAARRNRPRRPSRHYQIHRTRRPAPRLAMLDSTCSTRHRAPHGAPPLLDPVDPHRLTRASDPSLLSTSSTEVDTISCVPRNLVNFHLPAPLRTCVTVQLPGLSAPHRRFPLAPPLSHFRMTRGESGGFAA